MDESTKKGRPQRPSNSTGANNLQPAGYMLKFILNFIQNASETQVHSRAFPLVCDTEGAE
jgi:hypothetical protein